MKSCLRKAFGIAAVLSFLMLAACSEPFAEEEGYFTISLSANENMRAVYPPTNTSDLKFIAKFKDTANGAEKTYTSDGNGTIQGKIDLGNYIVTMDVSLISDGSPYARGIAYDNPVAIGSGQNPIKVYAYDVNNAAPPVISAKPQGPAYSKAAATAFLTVAASVNDGGVLSYQWYSNTTNSTSGAKAIDRATLPSYTPPTGTSGTTWYYVVVKNTSVGKPTTINTVPVSIVNSGTGGSGSEADPFLVNDVTTLRKVGTGTDGWTLYAHYRQTADISLPAVSQGESNWTPIGTILTPFTGSYDGNGKIISNLTINASTEDDQGLFGIIDSGAVVKNVGVVNCAIIVSTSNIVGGVVGSNRGTVQYCYATGNLSSNNYAGGVVGGNNGKVQYCYATASISGSTVGGVVGQNNSDGTVQNCYATGNVSSDMWAGGIGGLNLGLIQNCYATGNVSGKSDVGGVVACLTNDALSSQKSTVKNCVALNPNVSGTTYIGRVLGWLHNSNGTPILANNYGRSDMNKDGGSTTWTNDLNDKDGASITSSNWGSQSWWTTTGNWDTAGWDFTNVWQWGGSLPILRNMPGTATQNPVVSVSGTGGSGGSGTVADPFLVYDVATLRKVGTGTDGWSLSAHYKQTANINLSSVSNWMSIGTGPLPDEVDITYAFKGSYDGSGHTISNLTINASTDGLPGLFGLIGESAVVKNVGVVNCAIGGVVGINYGTVQYCYATGNTSDNTVGGVIGINYGTVQYCYATSNISSNSSTAGGVVGYNAGTVQYCYATGNVSGIIAVGGVVGANIGIIKNCYATGNVSKIGSNPGGGGVLLDYFVGGVVGENYGTLQYCYATGNVSSDRNAGGVVGDLTNENKSSSETTVQNCIALNSDISASSDNSIDYFGRVLGNYNGTPTLANNYGRSNMKMNGGSTTWTNIGLNDLDGASITSSNWGSQSWWTTPGNWDTAGWDFTNVWQWRSNSLPILRNMPGTATQNPVVTP